MGLRRTQIHLYESQYETLRQMAHEQRTTMADLVRQAIDQYLNNKEEDIMLKKLENDYLGVTMSLLDFDNELTELLGGTSIFDTNTSEMLSLGAYSYGSIDKGTCYNFYFDTLFERSGCDDLKATAVYITKIDKL